MEELKFSEIEKGKTYKNIYELVTHTPITKRNTVIPKFENIFIRNIFYESDEIKLEIEFFNGWTDYLRGNPEELSGLMRI